MPLTIHTLRDEIRAILRHHPEAHVARQQVLEALDGYHKSDGSETVPTRVEDIGEGDFYLAELRPDVAVFRGLLPELGQKSTCQSCHRPIIFQGQYWQHSDYSPRHPARPQDLRRDSAAKTLPDSTKKPEH